LRTTAPDGQMSADASYPSGSFRYSSLSHAGNHGCIHGHATLLKVGIRDITVFAGRRTARCLDVPQCAPVLEPEDGRRLRRRCSASVQIQNASVAPTVLGHLARNLKASPSRQNVIDVDMSNTCNSVAKLPIRKLIFYISHAAIDASGHLTPKSIAQLFRT
jgi:hypothetical protein